MARVPTPVQPGVEVGGVKQGFTATPYQRINAPIEAFGGGQNTLTAAAEGLNGFVEGLGKIVEEKKKNDENIALLEMQNKSSDMERDMLFNPETGMFYRKMGNARGATKDAQEKLRAYEESIDLEGMAPTQRIATERHLLQLKASVLNNVAAHERKETTDYEVQLNATAIGNAQQAAALGFLSNTAINEQRSKIIASAGRLADYNGLDKEGKEQFIQEELGKMYGLSIKAAIEDKKMGRARELLAVAKGKDGKSAMLSGEQIIELEKAMNSEEDGALARTAGDDAFSKYGDNQEAAYKALKEQGLPDSVLEKAHDQYKERATDNKAQRENQLSELDRRLSVAAGNGELPSDADLDQLPAPRQRAIMAEYRYQKRAKQYGGPVESDPAVKRSWMGMSTADRASIPQAQLYDEILSKMIPDDADEILSEWRDAKETQGSLSKTEREKRAAIQRSARSTARSQFDKLVEAKLGAVASGTTESDKAKRSAMKYVLIREFEQRNNSGDPMDARQMDEFLNSATTRLLLDPKATFDTDETFLALTGANFGDEEGDTKVGFDEVKGVLGSVPAEDRFDMVRWYMRDGGISAGTRIDSEKLGKFIAANYSNITSTVVRGTPLYPDILAEIDRLDAQRVTPMSQADRDKLAVNMYRKYLVETKGR